jgi:hypothetical protein
MSHEYSCPDSHQPAIRRIVQGIANVIAEHREAQRRLVSVRMSPDRYVFAARHAPDSYEEFLFRTAGALPHEPSARARAGARRPVR